MKSYKNIFFTIIISLIIVTIAGCKPESLVSPDQRAGNTTIGIQTGEAPNHGNGFVSLKTAKFLFSNISIENAEGSRQHQITSNSVVGIVNMDQKMSNIVVGTVPPGDYNKLSFVVQSSAAAERQIDPEFINEYTKKGYTVVITGIYNGQPFTYKSDVFIKKELPFNAPVSWATDSDITVTLRVAPQMWFMENGQALDPSVPENKSIIDENIINSFNGITVAP